MPSSSASPADDLERERERFAAIVAQSADCIGIADAVGRLVYLNEAGQRLVGLPAERVATTTAIDFFLPDDVAFVTETIGPRLAAEGRWEGVFRFRHFVSGAELPIQYNVFALKDPASGAITAYASSARDLRATITRDRDMAALFAAEQAARAIVAATQIEHAFLADAIPDQVWTANPEGALTHVNARVAAYFARTPEEMVGAGWQEVVHPDDLPQCIARWVASLASGAPYECEFRLLRASDATFRWHIARALCLRDASGAIVKWYGSNTDIEDRKRAEHDRDQLIVALSTSNHELDRFAYVASHDLRAPLRGISNLAQWLEEDLGDDVSEDTKKHLSMLRGRIARMDALIDGILDYSRAGRTQKATVDVDVGKLLASVVELATPGPNARVVIDPDMPRIATSPVALQQVFLNLIGNALKHARRDDPVVRVSAEGSRGPEQPLSYRFSVSDNGPGIDPRFHDRIWGLFQTLQPRDQVEGSGIGLSIAKKLVESRGGQIGVTSALGEGATFWFTWPKSER